MFEIEAIKAVARDLQKIDPKVVKEIETIHFKNIRKNLRKMLCNSAFPLYASGDSRYYARNDAKYFRCG